MKNPGRTPVLALLAGALVWGVIWYPYRLLEQSGIPAQFATFINYLVALLLGLVLLHQRQPIRWQWTACLPAIALAAGWANLGYILAVVEGEVMRVLLLFYTAPVWTLLFARILLSERLCAGGIGVMLISLTGALIMLWEPAAGIPQLSSRAEWFGLTAGMMFALTNVLVAKDAVNPVEIKSLAAWIGVTVVSLGYFSCNHWQAWPSLQQLATAHYIWLLAGLGIVIFAANLIVQYAVTQLPANRAITILLSELIFAAISAWLLQGETLSLRDWLGGGADRLGQPAIGIHESRSSRPLMAL